MHVSNKNFYITTPIYYSSGKLHIGHAYTTIMCDVIARYKKSQGYEVFYLTGTDEHGEKVQQMATKANKTPKQFVDDLVIGYKELWSKLHIDYNHFIRTTDENHKQTVQKIFSKLLSNGDIYKGVYQGWYCTPCESFWTKGQLKDEKYCPDCGREVKQAQEDAYFFKMSKYADKLVEYYNQHPEFIEPEARKNEMINNFIKPGLEDLCVSRTSFDWGIKVKEDPRHVVYVWIDALSNYITALGYDSKNPSLFNKFWANQESEVLHVVGKEIVRFHVIYWPIMLLALGLRLPTKIIGHGWIVMKGGKMSKSVGNVLYPNLITDRFGVDALRFYLAFFIPFGSDGVFTPELFIENFNVNLVNNYGNLLSRTTSMIEKYYQGITPNYQGNLNDLDQKLELEIDLSVKHYQQHMDLFHVDQAGEVVFNLLSKANKYIEDSKPWALAKESSLKPQLDSVLNRLVRIIRISTIMLKPILVDTTPVVLSQIGAADSDLKTSLNINGVNGNKVIKKDVLFPRLDPEEELKYFEEKMNQ
jgi:methionyl-tRNA synthetase